MPPTTPALDQLAYLRQIMSRLDDAKHGQRGAILRGACDFLGCSTADLYRRLHAVGFVSGRKRRSDAGTTCVDDAEAETLGSILMQSTRANGKRLLSVEAAMTIAVANGAMRNLGVTPSTVHRALRAKGMHPSQSSQLTPSCSMRSEHPNALWQIDVSVCVLYYLDKKGLAVASEREFYKNKPKNLARISDKRVLRYLVTDHYTGAMYLEYLMGSEDTENLFRFFCNAITQREHPQDPFHGVPLQLMMDPGSANLSEVFTGFLKQLDVDAVVHLPGNPRAKGSVERGHDLVERNFEGLLGIGTRVDDLAHLNTLAQQWSRWFNGTRIHSRHKHTRYGLWQTIRPEELRIAPSHELLRSLLTTRPAPCKIARDLSISFAVAGAGSNRYSVREVPGARVGETLLVAVNPYQSPNVNVITRDRDGNEVRLELTPILRDRAGFDLSAPIIGHTYRGAPDTDVDTARKSMLKTAFGVETVQAAEDAKRKRTQAFAGRIDPFAHMQAETVATYMQRKGTELPIAAPRVEQRPLNHVQASKALSLRGVEMSRERYAALQAAWPTGVPHDQVESLAARWLHGASTAVADAPLAATGTASVVPRLSRVK